MATKSFRMTNHVPRNNRAGDVNDRNNSADAARKPLSGRAGQGLSEYRNGQNSDVGNRPELRGIVNRVSR